MQRGWNFLRPGKERELRYPARLSARERDAVVRGTADAVYQNIDIIRAWRPELWSFWLATTSTRDGLRADAASMWIPPT